MRTTLPAALFLLLSSCSAPAYEDTWGESDIVEGKADGLLDHARELSLGQTISGSVTSESIELYSIDLRNGDEIEVVMTATSGDLSPHVTLHNSLFATIPSASFSAEEHLLTKTYAIESGGTMILAARAFRHKGAGEYTLSAVCKGGPCAGEFAEQTLDEDDIEECIAKAFDCSLEAIQKFNGNVGASRANEALQGCLDSTGTSGGLSCSTACATDEGSMLCADILGDLPRYADASPECIAVLQTCMEECTDPGFGGPFSVCYSLGFNGTCPRYMWTRQECGGDFEEGSVEDCHLFCESTTGAHLDDLDVICEESCGERPDIDL